MIVSSAQLCFIFGAGGHARVVLDAILLSGARLDIKIVDADQALHGQTLFDQPIVGGDEHAFQNPGALFVVAVGGTTSLHPRKTIYEKAVASGLKPFTVIHPKAIVSPRATISEGVHILPGAIVNCGAVIGPNTIINSGALIEHDCRIGAHVSIAPKAVVCGAGEIGGETFVGAGAVVKEGCSVGERSLIAAGAVVIRPVPADSIAKGVPAAVSPRQSGSRP
ncbi:MAG: acetyltransferase [Bdellovibrionota bacterium]